MGNTWFISNVCVTSDSNVKELFDIDDFRFESLDLQNVSFGGLCYLKILIQIINELMSFIDIRIG